MAIIGTIIEHLFGVPLIFTGLIAYLCLALYAAYDTCICTTN
jgi:hypothetical protein